MGTPIEQLQAIRRIRDYAVTLSLSPQPMSPDEAERLISMRQVAEREACNRSSIEAKHALGRRRERLEEEIGRLEALSGGSAPDEALSVTRLQRDRLVAELANVHNDIRRLRNEYEDNLSTEELRRLDDEEKEMLGRASRERLARYESQLAAWRDSEAGRADERRRLGTVRERLVAELDHAKKRLGEIREPLVSRTVAGFLLWAGYSSVAATGAAIAYLLTSTREQNALSALGRSMFSFAESMRTAVPAWLVLPLSIAILALLLVSVAGAFYASDRLIQHFDKNWRRRKPQQNGFSRTSLGLPSPEIGRRTYVQALALLPFAYIGGLAFVLLTFRGPTMLASSGSIGVTPAILHTAIGSVITLLTTAVFTLYIIKIIESRAQRPGADAPRWRSWEIAVPLALMLAAFGVAMARPAPDRYVWGAVALFMVVSSVALAYGVVYRGMFRDVDEVLRLLRGCDSDLEDLDTQPTIEDADRAERHDVRQIGRSYRQRRQQIIDEARRRRARRRDARPNDPSTPAAGATFIRRLFGGPLETTASVTSDWRVIDADAAPEQTRRRTELQRELSDTEQRIAEITAQAAANDVRARLDALRLEYRDVHAEWSTADERAAAEAARLVERQAIEIEEFRRAYAVGLMVRPAFELTRDRTRQSAHDATRYWRQPEVRS